MPKQALILRKFNSGIVTSADTTDLPMETCVSSYGLETVKKIGSLSGMKGNVLIDDLILESIAIDDYVHISAGAVDESLLIDSNGVTYWLSSMRNPFNPFAVPGNGCDEGVC